MNHMAPTKPLQLWKSIILFAVPSTYFILITNILIPLFNNQWKLHPAVSWFIGGYLTFVPLFVLALILYKREGNPLKLPFVLERFRITRLSREDIKWTVISAIVILTVTGLIMAASELLSSHFGLHKLETTPPFMQFQAFKGNEKYYLLLWLPMFFFNIVGEEILWRGYILPRQELQHGRSAWMLNAALWLVFHLCFGRDLLIILLPIIIVIPYTVSKTKNTLIGIITHGLLNGPMFVLVSLGLVG